jgi:hypothetical protein
VHSGSTSKQWECDALRDDLVIHKAKAKNGFSDILPLRGVLPKQVEPYIKQGIVCVFLDLRMVPLLTSQSYCQGIGDGGNGDIQH